MTAFARLARCFAFDDELLAGVSAGFEPDDWLRRPEGGGNHPQWLLGHLAASRRGALRLVGGEGSPVPWESLFQRGSAPGGPADDVAPEMLREAFLSAGRALRETLATLGPEAAARPLDEPLPGGAATVGDGLYFLFMHEAYHLGQIGLLRRTLGKAGVA